MTDAGSPGIRWIRRKTTTPTTASTGTSATTRPAAYRAMRPSVRHPRVPEANVEVAGVAMQVVVVDLEPELVAHFGDRHLGVEDRLHLVHDLPPRLERGHGGAAPLRECLVHRVALVPTRPCLPEEDDAGRIDRR